MTAPAGTAAATLISAVEDAGDAATVVRPGRRDPAAADTDGGQARYLRRRLFLALAFYIPLTDVSIQLSLFPSYRLPGWQWLLVAPLSGLQCDVHPHPAEVSEVDSTNTDTVSASASRCSSVSRKAPVLDAEGRGAGSRRR